MAAPTQAMPLAERCRPQFPLLNRTQVNGKPLVYFDNAATSQKPQVVLDRMSSYYVGENANVHRGVHHLSTLATSSFENARHTVSRFINAASPSEVVWTRNATEAINLVARSWGDANIGPGDEVVLSVAEHHSNMVPWHLLAKRTGAVLKHVTLTPDEQLDMESLRTIVTKRTKLVSLVNVSNMLGSILPVATVREIIAAQASPECKLLLDCCQSAPFIPTDVQALGADWVVFTGHKMCGPTGIGVLWGKYDLLASMPPFIGGGEMIDDVQLDSSTYREPPARFEAGTPAIAEAIGLAAACEYLTDLGMETVRHAEEQLALELYTKLSEVDGVRIYGPPPQNLNGRAALCSFNIEGLHGTDVATLLDQGGVGIRSGHHCTQPLHRVLGINASARASLYIYNTSNEIDTFIEQLKETVAFFRGLQ